MVRKARSPSDPFVGCNDFRGRKWFVVTGTTAIMESALSEIEFLALSPNRVAVLRRLAEESHTRTDLAVATGASQATLGRILRDFEERSWIRRVEGGYVATATGELIADGFLDLLAILEIEGELRPIVRYLPTDELGFDLRRFEDATITVPSGTKPNAPVKRVLDFLRTAADVRVFSHAFNEGSLRVIEERVSAGETTFEGVFSRSALDAVADDAGLRRRLGSLIDTPSATVRVTCFCGTRTASCRRRSTPTTRRFATGHARPSKRTGRPPSGSIRTNSPTESSTGRWGSGSRPPEDATPPVRTGSVDS